MWTFALALFLTQDFMKYMKPYAETPADLAVVKQLGAIDQALSAHDKAAYDMELARFRASKPRKALDGLTRSTNPTHRALSVMGLRLLPAKRIWDDALRFMLMDSSPLVRRQVLLYANEHPQGVALEAIQMPLSDVSPEVRIAAIFAVAKVARKKEDAAALFRQRLKEERDPAVAQKLRLGFTLLGLPSP